MPKVSILLAVYNGARYLSEAIESILAQTFADWEFIIIDDASKDATPEVLNRYTDPRIVRLHNDKNLGLARSLNRGLSLARGEYIARQDADDVSLPQRLAQQVAYLEVEPRTGLVGTTAIWTNEAGETSEIWQQPINNAQIQERLLQYCCFMHGSVMMRRQALTEVGGGYAEDMRTAQDYDLWLRISEQWDVAILPEPLYCYRWHSNMTTKLYREEQTANARLALLRALKRRLSLGYRLVFSPLSKTPDWVQRYSRAEWGHRFLWWAAGARSVRQGYPQRFAVISFLLHPGNPEWWSFMRGVVTRKLGGAAK